MAKQSGLGDNFYIGGYNISGDVGSLGRIGGGPALQDLTGIDKLAMERGGLVRDGGIEFSAFFNDAALAAHPALAGLLTTDRIATYFRGTTIGNPAASCVAKQIDYNPTRGADGSLTMATAVQANGYGLEWGQMMTAGIRTDTSATGGSASIDTGGSLSFGAQAYIQVFAFTGTDVTVRIQDSADDSAWANVSGFAFTQITSAPTAERIATVNTATIRRYVRFAQATASGFTNLQAAIMITKNAIAGQVF